MTIKPTQIIKKNVINKVCSSNSQEMWFPVSYLHHNPIKLLLANTNPLKSK